MRLTYTIVGKTLVGADVGGDLSAVEHAMETVLTHTFQSWGNVIDPPAYIPTPRNRRFRRAMQILDQIGDAAIELVQIIGQNAEQIDFGDVTDPAYVLLKNEESKESKRFVFIGKDANISEDNAIAILAPGQGISIPSPNPTLFAATGAEDARLLVLAIQR